MISPRLWQLFIDARAFDGDSVFIGSFWRASVVSRDS